MKARQLKKNMVCDLPETEDGRLAIRGARVLGRRYDRKTGMIYVMWQFNEGEESCVAEEFIEPEQDLQVVAPC